MTSETPLAQDRLAGPGESWTQSLGKQQRETTQHSPSPPPEGSKNPILPQFHQLFSTGNSATNPMDLFSFGFLSNMAQSQ